ncbi:hypothetical protein [Desulfosporosinus fructosivorans]
MRDKKLLWIVFAIVFLGELGVGYYMSYVKGFVFGDAISRVANAFYVLYIYPPHLASIGAVWNPIPSLLELPLLLLWPVYKPIASAGLAGVLISSIFAAGSAVLILRNCIHFGVSTGLGIVLTLLYAFNPFIFIYGFNGMSEMPFCFMIIWAVTSLTQWLEDPLPSHILKMGIALMLAFLTRYEAIPFAACIALSVAIAILFMRLQYGKSEHMDLKSYFIYLEGTLIVLLSPVVYTVIVWVLYNYIIMGDAFYFLHSNYSNSAQAQALLDNPIMSPLIDHPVSVIYYMLVKSIVFLAPFILILLIRLFSRNLLKWDFAILIILVLSINSLQFLMLFKGESYGWMRFFMYPLPILMAWIPYEFNSKWNNLRVSLVVVTLLLSALFMGWAVNNVNIASEEYKAFHSNDDYEKFENQREIAKFINEKLPDSRILMDSFTTYIIIIGNLHPNNLVVTCSYNFKDAVENPRDEQINYILVPSTVGSYLNKLDAINMAYPNLYENGADWCTLVKEFNNYRLYKVN